MKQAAEKKLSTTTPKSSTPKREVVYQHGFTVQTGTKAGVEPCEWGEIGTDCGGDCQYEIWRLESGNCI